MNTSEKNTLGNKKNYLRWLKSDQKEEKPLQLRWEGLIWSENNFYLIYNFIQHFHLENILHYFC